MLHCTATLHSSKTLILNCSAICGINVVYFVIKDSGTEGWQIFAPGMLLHFFQLWYYYNRKICNLNQILEHQRGTKKLGNNINFARKYRPQYFVFPHKIFIWIQGGFSSNPSIYLSSLLIPAFTLMLTEYLVLLLWGLTLKNGDIFW